MMENIRVRHPFGGAFGLILLFFVLQGSMVCCAADPGQKSKGGAKPVPTGYDASVRIIHDLINEYRTSQGLKPLELSPSISKVAADHSRNMAKGKVEFGHKGFEQRSKIIQQQMKLRSIAENVGGSMGQAEPEKEVLEGWLKSPGHLKNIEGDFELTGIGVSRSRKGMYFFTQIFVKILQ